MPQPTEEQIEIYRRDGFLIVERFLDGDDLDPLSDLLPLPPTGEIEIDETFFPVLWQDGYRMPWLNGGRHPI